VRVAGGYPGSVFLDQLAGLLVPYAGTTRDALVAATQRLSEDRIRVLGTILNDWNPKRSPKGYYGYYRGSYYYRYREVPKDS